MKGFTRRRFLASAMAGTAAAALAGHATAQETLEGALKLSERSTPNKVSYWEMLGQRFVDEVAPGVNFTVEPSDTGANYDTRLLTGSISRTVGDLAWLVTTQNFSLFQSRGLVQPVDELIERDGFDMSAYIDRTLEAVSVDGRLYMIPTGFHGGPISLFYNKELFDEAGIEYPNPDWTLGDFESAAQELTRPDRDQFGVLLPLDNPEALVVLSRCWGGDVLFDAGTRSGLSDENTRAMFEWVSGLINEKQVMRHPAELPRLPNGNIDYNGFFGSGRVAMWQASPWHATPLRLALGDEFGAKYDMTLIPPGPAGRNGQLVVEGYPIFSTTRNLEAAWAFTKFMNTREQGIERIEHGFIAAPRVDALSDPDLIASDIYYARYNQALIDAPPASASVPANSKITEMYTMLRLSFDGIWSGQQSVVDALAAADENLTDLLSQDA